MVRDAPLPYGLQDLDTNILTDPGPPTRIRCYVRGCEEFVQPPARGFRGETCPAHGIRCHTSGTYTYADPLRNIIVANKLFATKLLGNPFKFESHRFGFENSEDCISWNVFMALREARCLREVARLITGRPVSKEPRLFLWGLDTDHDLQPWDFLVAARKRFESKMPVKRPATEPDIALHIPGEILILIEAKVASANTWYEEGARKNNQSLTKAELLDIYQDLFLKILDVSKAREAPRVFYQLWRNMIFAEWMAMYEGQGAKAFHASLTRAWCENESCSEFSQLIRPGYEDRFAHVFWEDLFVLSGLKWRKLNRLQLYMLTKTISLEPAFLLGRL